MPKISVVIFSYNFVDYLEECIESVLAQTLLPYEVIICDDCSTDGSWEIISAYGRRYPNLIKVYRQERNVGPIHNGNFGRKKATGDLITLLDGDDRWLPRKLEMEWAAIKNSPGARVAYSNVYEIDINGRRTRVWFDGDDLLPSGDVFIETFSRRFFPNTRSVFRNHLMYLSSMKEVGYNDPDIETYMDWDEKIRLSARFPVVYSGGTLVEYRQHAGGFSKKDRLMNIRAHIQVYEKNLHLLEQRSIAESTRVRCNVESLIALSQSKLPPSKRNKHYSPRLVYERNRFLLDQLSHEDRIGIEEEIKDSFALLAWVSAVEATKKGEFALARSYWSEVFRYKIELPTIRQFAVHLLPNNLHRWLSDTYHRFGGRRY